MSLRKESTNLVRIFKLALLAPVLTYLSLIREAYVGCRDQLMCVFFDMRSMVVILGRRFEMLSRLLLLLLC